jgi:hypothetical protein
MRKFTCDEARAHLSDALAGEISRPDANVLEAHLLGCEPCLALSELFLWQDRVLTELAGQARIESLMSKVREGLQNLDQVPVDEEARPRWSLTISSKWVAAAAAFVLALIAVLFWKPRTPETPTAQNLTPAPRVDPAPAPPEPATPPVLNTPESPQPPPELQPPPKSEVANEEKKTPLPPTPPKAPPELLTQKPDPSTPNPNAPAPPLVNSPGREVVMAMPKARSLDEAVRDGMAFLKAKAPLFAVEAKSDELVLWTYVHGGMPENDPQFQSLLKGILEKPLERTYNVALTAMVLEELDRTKYQKRIAQCAQYLVDNQCTNGQWGYGDPSIFAADLILPPLPPKSKGLRKVPITRKRDGLAAGDNSNSQYAMLGLRACHDAGIVLPAATIELAAKWWRESQSRITTVKAPALAPEGWCYGKHEHKPYGSMTVGGIGSLVICDYIQGKDAKKDREVANGMEWLAKNFSVAYNPGPYEHARFEENSQHNHLYYLYGLERAAILYGTEQIGTHFWFAKGMQLLIEQQRPDGSWRSASGNELHDTCFAILFLRKATRALTDVPTPGAGSAPKK